MKVTRIRPPGFDLDGNPIAGSPSRVEMSGFTVAPRFSIAARETASGAIEERGRAGAVIGLTLYGPFEPDIESTDSIEITRFGITRTYKVEGVPVSWENPFTHKVAGSEMSLKRTKG